MVRRRIFRFFLKARLETLDGEHADAVRRVLDDEGLFDRVWNQLDTEHPMAAVPTGRLLQWLANLPWADIFGLIITIINATH